jgi:hypothetical protein
MAKELKELVVKMSGREEDVASYLAKNDGGQNNYRINAATWNNYTRAVYTKRILQETYIHDMKIEDSISIEDAEKSLAKYDN